MDEEDVVPMYDGILLSHKKEWNFAICSNMDGFYVKWNKSEKDTVYHLHVESKKQTNDEYNKIKTDSQI